MTESTWRDMTTEHLGRDATPDDLDLFQRACQVLTDRGMTDQEATDQIWGEGDWLPRAHAALYRDELGA